MTGKENKGINLRNVEEMKLTGTHCRKLWKREENVMKQMG